MALKQFKDKHLAILIVLIQSRRQIAHLISNQGQQHGTEGQHPKTQPDLAEKSGCYHHVPSKNSDHWPQYSDGTIFLVMVP